MTIKDIAKLADVSVSTVSRVLNDRPDVSEDSRRRVRAVIEAHRYVPNNSARDLVKIRPDAVGLVVRGVQNPFYTDIIHAIEQKLDASGYTMVMRQIPSGDDEIQCGAVMEKEKRLRGIIFLGGRSDYSPEEVSLLGVPYVWGGTSLTHGCDCSGFTQSVLKNFGISVPRVSRDQARSGSKVTSANMRPGDLIFYANRSGTINHVGMYIGNGQVVNAASTRSGIRIYRWNYRTPVAIRNVIGD